MKFATFTSIIFAIWLSSCQQKKLPIKDLDAAFLHSSISVKGKLLEAKEWKDSKGDNLLVISRYRPPTKTYLDMPGFTTESVFLYINHYIKEKRKYQLIWSKTDSIINCVTDFWIGILENSTAITDLDNDGISEITIIYSHACRGDVSPSYMDLIITEGNEEHNLQGKMYLAFNGKQLNKEAFITNLQKLNLNDSTINLNSEMGRYKNEEDFVSAPQVFLDFARNKWIEYVDRDEFRQLNGTKD